MVRDTELRILWALLRPQTYLLMCIYVFLGITFGLSVQNYQLSAFLADNFVALLGILCGLALWYIAGTAFNDYADYEIDKVNLKHDAQRPLVQGAVTRVQLLRYAQLASLASLVTVALTNMWPIILLFAIMLGLNMAYSLRPIQISRRGGVAQLLLPLGYIVLTVNAGLLLTGVPYEVMTYVLVAAMYLHFIARLALKDHRDVRGDAKAGKKTLILKYGNTAVVRLAMALFIISTILLVSVLWQNWPKAIPFVALLASGALVVLAQLSKETRWAYQKPLITIFGRLCSGAITIIIISLMPGFLNISNSQLVFIQVLVCGMFFISIFDIIRLQHPLVKT